MALRWSNTEFQVAKRPENKLFTFFDPLQLCKRSGFKDPNTIHWYTNTLHTVCSEQNRLFATKLFQAMAVHRPRRMRGEDRDLQRSGSSNSKATAKPTLAYIKQHSPNCLLVHMFFSEMFVCQRLKRSRSCRLKILWLGSPLFSFQLFDTSIWKSTLGFYFGNYRYQVHNAAAMLNRLQPLIYCCEHDLWSCWAFVLLKMYRKSVFTKQLFQILSFEFCYSRNWEIRRDSHWKQTYIAIQHVLWRRNTTHKEPFNII